jgi:hypothetical protein
VRQQQIKARISRKDGGSGGIQPEIVVVADELKDDVELFGNF